MRFGAQWLGLWSKILFFLKADVYSAKFSPNGQTVASASQDRRICKKMSDRSRTYTNSFVEHIRRL